MSGTASQIHERPLVSDRPVLEIIEVEDHAIVLGSAQRTLAADRLAATRLATEPPGVNHPHPTGSAGPSLVRRRGGGGAVWVGPTEGIWFDVSIPTTDHRWVNDVGVAFEWLGDALELWLRPWLDQVGAEAVVHRGGLRAGPYSDVVCFAGTGPGEVFVGGRKLIGISQRRVRTAARFMCWMPTVWSANDLVGALVDPAEASVALAAVSTAGVGLADLGIDATEVKRNLVS